MADETKKNEEVKQEEIKKVEEVKAESAPKEEKTVSVKLSDKLAKIATEIEKLTVLELSELSSYLEDKFGVSAMPVAAVAAPVAGAAAEAAPAEEKSSYDVVLTDGGANKLNAIKAVRELRQDLGLMEAKALVESTPKEVLKGVKKEEAEAAVKKLVDAGGKAEMK